MIRTILILTLLFSITLNITNCSKDMFNINTEYIYQLLNQLDDDNALNREKAIIAIGELGSLMNNAVLTLVNSLNDENRDVRAAAIVSLEKFGPLAIVAVPQLVEIIGSEESMDIRLFAARAVNNIGPSLIDIKPLIALLNDDYDGIRWYVSQAIIDYGEFGVPSLIEALDYDNVNMQLEVIKILGLIGPDAGLGLPKLYEIRARESDIIVLKTIDMAISRIEVRNE